LQIISEKTITMNDKKVKTNSFEAWVLAARPKTLSGAAVPVMIGLALAWVDAKGYHDEPFSWVAAVLCLLFAFIMQIDANFVNDFFDYAKGTDDRETRLGPERACSQGWVTPEAMKQAIAITTCVACMVGLPLVFFGGLEMILVGITCVVFCFLYTTHLSYIGLGDVLVLLFFGLVPVSITYYIQLHTLTAEVLIASLACGVVIDGLLLVNNFRDRDTDRVAGKETLVVRIGAEATLNLYLSVGIMACLMGGVFLLRGNVLAFVLPMLYLILHIYTWLRMKQIWQGRELNKCLGETARNIFVYGIMLSVGILFG
jgi:1,4-dihydroxy-2-naphthoate octaprenyltransferase